MPTIVKWKYVERLLAELPKPAYDGLSDQQVAAKLNESQPTGQKTAKEISVAELARVLFEQDKLHTLRIAAETGNANAQRLIALLTIGDGAEGASLNINPDSGRVKEVITALVQAALLNATDVAALRAAASEDEMGPSLARDIGIGAVFPENLKQLRAYLASGDETEIKEDLAKILLIRCVRHIRHGGVSIEDYLQTQDWTDRLATIAEYTTVSDAARLEELLREMLAEVK